FAPGDGDAWPALFEEWERIGDAVLRSLLSTFPPVRGGLDLVRALGSSAELLRFMRFGVLPVRRLAEERFTGEGARLLLAGNALHSDLTPESALSGLFGWLLAMLGQDVGFPVPEGGAERLIDALVARLRSRGGQVRCEARVAGIVVDDGRATGVRLADGGVVRARHAVLADVPAPALYRSMIAPEHLPPRLLRDLEAFQWDNGTVKVDWALSTPVPWTQPEVRGSGTVHLGADLDGLTRYGASLAMGEVPERPFMLFGQMATADPTRCPPGTEVAWGYTHVPWGAPMTGDDVQRVVDRMEAALERAAPGFTGSILGRYVAGPAQLQATNPSLVHGAINSGTTAMHQQLFFRPVPGMGRPETPIRGLYLASASAHPGGGVHGACGANAARVALARRRPHGAVVDTGLHWALRRLYRESPGLPAAHPRQALPADAD
ncbi:MAG: NAD(P)/FAD-dependent oxidoreductase, partial [Geodermatophilaceae bacterium]|nr:NAD(P)/FAD-dependent oxidoreductase [Geodermatophilaceae bacterium]